jgi:hypothetical protein
VPQFLADESCDFAVVRGLRAAGHDVLAISERARGAADQVVIAMAVAEQRILITEDTDFGQLVYAHAHAFQRRDPDSLSSARPAEKWPHRSYNLSIRLATA